MNDTNLLIPRKAVITMGAKHGFDSIVSCLSYLQKNPSKLGELMKENKMQLRNGEGAILFHGSRNQVQTLRLSQTIDANQEASPDALVYATSDPNYAIFLATLHTEPGGSASALVSEEKTEFSISIGFVNGESKLDKGYVHIVGSAGFKDAQNSEFESRNSVQVICSIEVSYRDMTVPIIIRYNI